MNIFVAAVTARTVVALVDINRQAAILFYHKIREVIAARLNCVAEEMSSGEIELDESYFGGVTQ